MGGCEGLRGAAGALPMFGLQAPVSPALLPAPLLIAPMLCKQPSSEQSKLLLCIKAREISLHKNEGKFINSKLLLKRSPYGEQAQMLACIVLVSQFLSLPPFKHTLFSVERTVDELSTANRASWLDGNASIWT